MDRYETLAELGKNHYATVWEGFDYQTNRKVAIMELSEKLLRDPRKAELVWRDVQAMADISDKNLVSVHDIVPNRGWVVMELMRGHLGAYVGRQAVTQELARSVLRQVLEALDKIHRAGRCHGDVKPRNMLYNDEGRIFLGFSPGLYLGGVALYRQEDQKYQAPELLNADAFGEVGPAADLYCLGFSVLELLKGPGFDALFRGAGVDPQTAWTRWHGDPDQKLPAAREVAPNLDPEMASVIDRLLRKRVADRYQSAAQVLGDIHDAPLAYVDVPSEATVPSRRAPMGQAVQIEAESPFTPEPIRAPAPKPKSDPRRPVAEHGRTPAPVGRAPVPVPGDPPPKRWSREWINKKLENPWIMGGVLALLLLPVLFVLWAKIGGGEPPEQTLALAVEAPDADEIRVTIDDDKPVVARDGKAVLAIARQPEDKKVTIAIEADGYEPATATFERGSVPAEHKIEMVKKAPRRAVAAAKPPLPASREIALTVEPHSAGEVEILVDGKQAAVAKDGKARIRIPSDGPDKAVIEFRAAAFQPLRREYDRRNPELEDTVVLQAISPAPKPTPKPKPKPEAASLVIQLQNAEAIEAEVALDDRPPARTESGKAEVRVPLSDAGPVKVEVRAEGYEPFVTELDRGKLPPVLPVTLVRKQAKTPEMEAKLHEMVVRLDTVEAIEADVQLDDKPAVRTQQGQTKLRVPLSGEGPVKIAVRAPGYKAVVQELQRDKLPPVLSVAMVRDQAAATDMKPGVHEMLVRLEAAEAVEGEVRVDGKGPTPTRNGQVRLRIPTEGDEQVLIEVTAETYLPWRKKYARAELPDELRIKLHPAEATVTVKVAPEDARAEVFLGDQKVARVRNGQAQVRVPTTPPDEPVTLRVEAPNYVPFERQLARKELPAAISVELVPAEDPAMKPYRRGTALMEKKDPEGAIAQFNKAIELNPKMAEAYRDRGRAKNAKKDFAGAVADLRRAAELAPKDAAVFLQLGHALADSGQPEPALEAYKRAIELDPKQGEAHSGKALVHFGRGEFKEALDACETGGKAVPGYAPLQNIAGTALVKLGQPEKAMEAFGRAIELAPDDYRAYLNRGRLRWSMAPKAERGKASAVMAQALADFNEAIRLSPEDAAAYNARGVLYLNTGRRGEALADFRRAVELAPQVREYRENLALVGAAPEKTEKVEKTDEGAEPGLKTRPKAKPSEPTEEPGTRPKGKETSSERPIVRRTAGNLPPLPEAK